MIKQIIEKLAEADVILTGLGEELDILNEIRQEQQYKEIAGRLTNLWVLPYVEKAILNERKKNRHSFYQPLTDRLEGKNYFIVTTCLDGLIRESGLNKERIVEPCGGYEKLQCSQKCSPDLYEVPEEFLLQVKEFINGRQKEENLKMPVCPHCNASLVFNNINEKNYLEEGYLDKWQLYKKWLQGTINKKICLLEIGVGLRYPTVVRWPFEKITFYNQKADLFRIHSRIYQITEEIKERGHGICQKPEDFLKELSKGI